MARKKAHEDHANHEAWAIPYGDLVTLLLALFVVLYSMSAVNEGKFRVLSDSLNEAFGGKPRSPWPIQIGEKAERSTRTAQKVSLVLKRAGDDGKNDRKLPGTDLNPIKSKPKRSDAERASLQRMAEDVQNAMGDLIDRNLIVVRRTDLWLEIEIRTDILFASGVAQISDTAQPVLAHLAAILKPFPNPIRIEGHTDDRPINTLAFPSNWQLSSSRAVSVVSLFMQQGVDPTRMSVAGFGEYHPVVANDTVEGRNRNRRVLIIVLGDDDASRTAQLGKALDLDQPQIGAPASADEHTELAPDLFSAEQAVTTSAVAAPRSAP